MRDSIPTSLEAAREVLLPAVGGLTDGAQTLALQVTCMVLAGIASGRWKDCREVTEAADAVFGHLLGLGVEAPDDSEVMAVARAVNWPDGGVLAAPQPSPDEVIAREFLMSTPRPEAASTLMTECFMTMLSLFCKSAADPNSEVRTAARALWDAVGAADTDAWHGPEMQS